MILFMLVVLVLVGGACYYAGLITGRRLSDKVNIAGEVNKELAGQVEALHETIKILRRDAAMKDRVLENLTKARRPTPGTEWT